MWFPKGLLSLPLGKHFILKKLRSVHRIITNDSLLRLSSQNTTYRWLKQQKLISFTSRGWEPKTKWPVGLVFGEGSHPGHILSVSSHGREREKE